MPNNTTLSDMRKKLVLMAMESKDKQKTKLLTRAVSALYHAETNHQTTDREGKTPLHHVAASGSLEVMQDLVGTGADIDKADDLGVTPLHYAIESGCSLEVVTYLLQEGANPQAPDNNGYTALHRAAERGHVEVVQYLVEKTRPGSNINPTNCYQKTPLHYAADNGYVEVVQCLVGAGADINKADNNGHTALHYAAARGHVEVVQCLVGAGADINKADNNGYTALHCVAERGHVEVVQCLVGVGADINKADANGLTPLHDAAARGFLEVVRCLINEGADIHALDQGGRTLLHTAAANGSLKVVRYLVQETDAGDDIESPDNQGRTPLTLAIESHFSEVKRCLLKEIAIRTLEERILPDLMQTDEISYESIENPVTTIVCPFHIFSRQTIEEALRRNPEEPFTRQPCNTGDIIPVFSARNVFLVAAGNALAKLDSEDSANGQASDNNIRQFDRRTLELELILLEPESLLCAEYYLEQFCRDDGDHTVYLPENTRERTEGEKKLFGQLQVRIFGSEEMRNGEKTHIPGEINELEKLLNRDGSIKPGLVPPAEETLSQDGPFSEPLLLSGGPQPGSSTREVHPDSRPNSPRLN